jgi:hypothetical protein
MKLRIMPRISSPIRAMKANPTRLTTDPFRAGALSLRSVA